MKTVQNKTPTLGVIYGNRDFFPDLLVSEARADIAKLFGQLSIKAIQLSETDSKLGGALAAVVIGGNSLSGGGGLMLGAVLGCLIIGVLDNGLFFLDVSPFGKQVVEGIVILAAVAADKMGARLD